ncbi:MAG: SusC/RagA family TonB-linked outer membrane protein [Gemmatimonadetes bacterium]|nr:SusC/RagA family TonB-linked outer membrane protein [Gemmatimonadota bacterium]
MSFLLPPQDPPEVQPPTALTPPALRRRRASGFRTQEEQMQRTHCLGFAALVAAFVLAAPSVGAQQIAGRVTDGRSGQPMAAVQVFIAGSGIGALSQQNGRFLLLNVPVGTQTLTAQRIGYSPVTKQVTVVAGQTTQLDFEMTEEALGLDEIIVTGTPGGTQRRAIGNAVTSVDASDVTKKIQVNTMQDLLTGRSPGAQFSRNNGNVGTGARIQIRGVKSFNLTSDPLIFVDGIRIDNKASRGPSLGDNREVNPLDEINPQDIQSIEIIKGPAAATLYGTEASAGVIQIITKRGAQGSASFEASVRQGVNYMRDPAGRLGTFWACKNSANGVCTPESGNLVGYNPYDEANRVIHDGTIEWPVKDLFQTGASQSYNLSITGGVPAARYFLSTNYDYDEGVEYWNQNKALRLRANVNVVFSEKFTLDVSTGFTDGFTQFGQQVPTDGGLWEDLVWGNGYCAPAVSGPHPECARLIGGFQEHLPPDVADIDVTRDFQRFTGSATMSVIPTSWLTTRMVLGLDRGWEVNTTLFPLYAGRCGLIKDAATCSASVYPRTREGEIILEKPATTNISLDLGATARAQVTDKIGSASSVGLQFYTRQEDRFATTGRGFASPLSTTVNQTPVSKSTINYEFIENKSAGFYVQEEVNWAQRIFVTGALRFDDNSAFGSALDPEIYPKLAATWTVSDESFFGSVPVINSLRMRSAWGTSGRQPDAFARVTRYSVIGGPSGTTALSPDGPGNPAVGPEKSTELEMGFDVALFNSRVSSEFTMFRAKTEGALLNLSLPPSLGQAGSIQRNLGQLDNWGWEVSVNSRLYESSLLSASLDVTGSHVDNKIVALGEFPGNNNIKIGYPYPNYTTRYFIESADYNAAGKVVDGYGRKILALCDKGTRLGDTPKHGLVRGGDAVDCQSKDAERILFGRGFYTYRFSVTPTFSLFENALTLHVMADGAHGKKSQNTRDAGARYNNYYQSRCECDPFWVAGDRYATPQVWGFHDAGFWKLREIGLRANLPSSLIGRLGADRASLSVSARELANLWVAQADNWGAHIADPEESRIGDGEANYRVMPPLSRLSAELRLTF